MVRSLSEYTHAYVPREWIADGMVTGGAANAYVPSADEEKVVEQEENHLRRVFSASRDRLKDVLEQHEEKHNSDSASVKSK